MNRKNIESFDVARSAPRKQTKQAPRAERKGNSDAPQKKVGTGLLNPEKPVSVSGGLATSDAVTEAGSHSPEVAAAEVARSEDKTEPITLPKKRRAKGSRRSRNG